jgi:formylglycine-generating enzyme required for sulfatase activity
MDNGGRLGIWDFDIDSWHEKACFKAGRNLTQDEWGLYFPHEPYRATCPQFAENPDQAEIDFSDISTRIREIDDMVQVFIPSGEFEYGSSTWTDDGGIFRIIDLDAFWIDQTEVSNAQYQLCVAAGACTPPASNSSETRTGGYYGSETYAAYPVVFISFSQAEEYCRWVGGRLPLETEWEKAARGTSGYDYPWGNSPPEPDYVNFHYLNPDTVAVDSYPAGASPYGVLNMAGNVSEWAYDYPMEGESDLPLRIRGGAYDDTYVYTWMIESSFDGYYWNDIGFRCVDDE